MRSVRYGVIGSAAAFEAVCPGSSPGTGTSIFFRFVPEADHRVCLPRLAVDDLGSSQPSPGCPVRTLPLPGLLEEFIWGSCATYGVVGYGYVSVQGGGPQAPYPQGDSWQRQPTSVPQSPSSKTNRPRWPSRSSPASSSAFRCWRSSRRSRSPGGGGSAGTTLRSRPSSTG